MAVYCRFSVIFPAVQQTVKKREQCLQVSAAFIICVFYFTFILDIVLSLLTFFKFANALYQLQFLQHVYNRQANILLYFLALAHPGSPGKKGRKTGVVWLWWLVSH